MGISLGWCDQPLTHLLLWRAVKGRRRLHWNGPSKGISINTPLCHNPGYPYETPSGRCSETWPPHTAWSMSGKRTAAFTACGFFDDHPFSLNTQMETHTLRPAQLFSISLQTKQLSRGKGILWAAILRSALPFLSFRSKCASNAKRSIHRDTLGEHTLSLDSRLLIKG